MTESYTLKEGLVDHERRIKLLENGLRTGNLAYSSVENGTIPFYDSSGQPRIFMGKQNDGTFAITYGNGPKPPPPSKPAVTAIQLGFVIGWDGTFTGGVDRPADVVRVDVHMSETANFKPDGSTVIGSIFDEGAVSVNADVTAKEFLLVAVTSGDVPSDPSARVTKTALPAGQLAAGSVKADTIAAGAITTDKLQVGVIPELPDNLVTTDNISSNLPTNVVTDANFASKLPANVITTNNISSNIPGNVITENNIATKLPVNVITDGNIASRLPPAVVTSTNIGANLPTYVVTESNITSKLPSTVVTESNIGSKLPSTVLTSGNIQYNLPSNVVTTANLEANIPSSVITKTNISTNLPTTVVTDANIINKLPASVVTDTNLSEKGVVTKDNLDANIPAVYVKATELEKFATADASGNLSLNAKTIAAEHLAIDSVTEAAIAIGAISEGKIQNGAIVADKIAANQIGATHIVSSAITTNHIKANAITTTLIQAGAVNTAQIAAGAISADKLAANLILGTKIIGGSATNGRVEMSQLGLQSFAENGLKSWEVNTNGHMFFYDTRNSVTANTPTIRVLATGEMEFVNNNTGRTTMQFSSDGQFRVFNPSGAKMMHINNQGLLEIFAPDTGARTFGIKSDGQVYAGKADGTATFVIDKTGQVLVTGRIRTAVTGDRMELLPSWASNTNGQLSFISRSDEAAYFWSSSFMDTDGKYKPTVMMMTPPRADNWYMVTKWGGGNKEIFAIVAQNTKLNWAYGQTVPRARIVINDLFVHISAGTNPGEPGYVQGNWSSNLYLQSEGNPFIDKNCAPMLYAMYQPSGSSTNWYCGIVFDSRAERAAVVYQNSGVQARTWAGDAWTPFAGAQYINLSAVETKTDIDELPDPGLEVIRQAPASRWRYKRRASDDYLHGPMADDLPSWLTISAPAEYKHMPGEQDDVLLVPPEPNAALDNASMIGVLWDAIRDLDIEFDTMRRQLGIEIPERKYDHEPVERSAEFSEFYTIDEVPTNG